VVEKIVNSAGKLHGWEASQQARSPINIAVLASATDVIEDASQRDASQRDVSSAVRETILADGNIVGSAATNVIEDASQRDVSSASQRDVSQGGVSTQDRAQAMPAPPPVKRAKDGTRRGCMPRHPRDDRRAKDGTTRGYYPRSTARYRAGRNPNVRPAPPPRPPGRPPAKLRADRPANQVPPTQP
jgi:hypothetical protein